MSLEIILSIAAILLATFSLILSIFVVFRDRSNLKAESKVFKHEESGEYYNLYLKATNEGRRPIVLVYLLGKYEEKKESYIYIDHKNNGKKLDECEFYENRIGKHDGEMCAFELTGDLYELVDLLFIDSSGHKYKIKDSKKNIKLLRESNHSLGMS